MGDVHCSASNFSFTSDRKRSATNHRVNPQAPQTTIRYLAPCDHPSGSSSPKLPGATSVEKCLLLPHSVQGLSAVIVVFLVLDLGNFYGHSNHRPLLFRVVERPPYSKNALGPPSQAGRRRTSLKGGNRGMCRCQNLAPTTLQSRRERVATGGLSQFATFMPCVPTT